MYGSTLYVATLATSITNEPPVVIVITMLLALLLLMAAPNSSKRISPALWRASKGKPFRVRVMLPLVDQEIRLMSAADTVSVVAFALRSLSAMVAVPASQPVMIDVPLNVLKI